MKSRLGTSPNRKTIFCSFSQDGDSILNCEKGRQTLTAVGIYCHLSVGDWLCNILTELKQQHTALSLKSYLESKAS